VRGAHSTTTAAILIWWAESSPRGEGVPPLRPWFRQGKERGQDALATNHAAHRFRMAGVLRVDRLGELVTILVDLGDRVGDIVHVPLARQQKFLADPHRLLAEPVVVGVV
jgi:hypothetical protein